MASPSLTVRPAACSQRLPAQSTSHRWSPSLPRRWPVAPMTTTPSSSHLMHSKLTERLTRNVQAFVNDLGRQVQRPGVRRGIRRIHDFGWTDWCRAPEGTHGGQEGGGSGISATLTPNNPLLLFSPQKDFYFFRAL